MTVFTLLQESNPRLGRDAKSLNHSDYMYLLFVNAVEMVLLGVQLKEIRKVTKNAIRY